MPLAKIYIELSTLVPPEHARGVQPGILAREQLIIMIEKNPDAHFIELSMKHFAFIDVSFARECIIQLIRYYAGKKAIVLANFQDDCLIENITVSTDRFKICVLSKVSGQDLRIHGPNDGRLSKKDYDIWEIVSQFDAISSSKLSTLITHLSSSAAHGKLKKLSDMGLMFKKRVIAKTGGIEDSFFPVVTNYE